MDKYAEKAREFQNDWRPRTPDSIRAMLAAFGRECAAQAFEEAASDVECLNSKYQPAFIRDEECPPCDDCVQGARLRGKAASLRSPHADKPKPCQTCKHPKHGPLCWAVKNEKGVATCPCSNADPHYYDKPTPPADRESAGEGKL